jgi:hypothetical protein
VAYSPDGKYALIGSSDGTAQLAYIDLDGLFEMTCARLLRDFTDDEYDIYSIRGKNPTCLPSKLQPTKVAATWTPISIPTATGS